MLVFMPETCVDGHVFGKEIIEAVEKTIQLIGVEKFFQGCYLIVVEIP
jgi:hypothetical protein